MSGCASKNEIQLFHSLDHNQSNTRKHIVASIKVSNHYPVYHIKRYDRVIVNILGDSEINTSAKGMLVDHQGYITLPMTGRIHIAGLSQPQAAQKIQGAFRQFYTDAIVAVEVPNKKLFVIGDVKKPGPISLPNERTTLLKAIAEAHGFNDKANREAVYLLRKKGSKADLQRLSLSGEQSLRNAFLILLPDDIIYVAPSSNKIVNLNFVDALKVIGAALSPFAAIKSIIK